MAKRGKNCSKCLVNPSVYKRAYSGERLCELCFKDSINKRVKQTISRFEMFEHNSRIALGVSGGKDSLGLLNILSSIEIEFPNAELIAVTVDEGIKGYRDEALTIAENACREIGVEHIVISFKDAFGVTIDEVAVKQRKLTPCSYCGVLRRRALNDAAKKIEADILVTAHNLDDMAQTALLNMLRGDINRLSMMSPSGRTLFGFVRRVKPFCEVPERESTFYAYLKGFEFQQIPCPFSEEGMRTDVRNFLNRMEVKRPGTKFIIYRTALKIASKNNRSALSNRCVLCGEPTTEKHCRVCQIMEELMR